MRDFEVDLLSIDLVTVFVEVVVGLGLLAVSERVAVADGCELVGVADGPERDTVFSVV